MPMPLRTVNIGENLAAWSWPRRSCASRCMGPRSSSPRASQACSHTPSRAFQCSFATTPRRANAFVRSSRDARVRRLGTHRPLPATAAECRLRRQRQHRDVRQRSGGPCAAQQRLRGLRRLVPIPSRRGVQRISRRHRHRAHERRHDRFDSQPEQAAPAASRRRQGGAHGGGGPQRIPRLRPDLPTCIGHCVYIRRSAIELVGEFDLEFLARIRGGSGLLAALPPPRSPPRAAPTTCSSSTIRPDRSAEKGQQLGGETSTTRSSQSAIRTTTPGSVRLPRISGARWRARCRSPRSRLRAHVGHDRRPLPDAGPDRAPSSSRSGCCMHSTPTRVCRCACWCPMTSVPRPSGSSPPGLRSSSSVGGMPGTGPIRPMSYTGPIRSTSAADVDALTDHRAAPCDHSARQHRPAQPGILQRLRSVGRIPALEPCSALRAPTRSCSSAGTPRTTRASFRSYRRSESTWSPRRSITPCSAWTSRGWRRSVRETIGDRLSYCVSARISVHKNRLFAIRLVEALARSRAVRRHARVRWTEGRRRFIPRRGGGLPPRKA